jgi:CheY-like chemotaxis protein
MKRLNLFIRENSSIYFGDDRKMEEKDTQEEPQQTPGEDPTPIKTVLLILLILLIEDDLDIRDALTAVIQDATPYQVIPVPDGFAALKVVRTLVPQLVLLDYLLPGMDGLECLDMLRASKGMEQTPVILMMVNKAQSGQVLRRGVITQREV